MEVSLATSVVTGIVRCYTGALNLLKSVLFLETVMSQDFAGSELSPPIGLIKLTISDGGLSASPRTRCCLSSLR